MAVLERLSQRDDTRVVEVGPSREAHARSCGPARHGRGAGVMGHAAHRREPARGAADRDASSRRTAASAEEGEGPIPDDLDARCSAPVDTEATATPRPGAELAAPRQGPGVAGPAPGWARRPPPPPRSPPGAGPPAGPSAGKALRRPGCCGRARPHAWRRAGPPNRTGRQHWRSATADSRPAERIAWHLVEAGDDRTPHPRARPGA